MYFKGQYAKIFQPNNSIAVGAVRQGDVYYLYQSIERTATTLVGDFVKWHFELGHSIKIISLDMEF